MCINLNLGLLRYEQKLMRGQIRWRYTIRNSDFRSESLGISQIFLGFLQMFFEFEGIDFLSQVFLSYVSTVQKNKEKLQNITVSYGKKSRPSVPSVPADPPSPLKNKGAERMYLKKVYLNKVPQGHFLRYSFSLVMLHENL